ncbi:MAG: methylenetetrahydrofolate dehydrogenase (NADP+) / methenyltetrahydrofolate cyclohydrolase [Parcubacteria group bacterium Gr01-1014_107]|nr:MAG: methylenetetrahydrofolate dehydrogenase (NADP+) / methenyltetrahydrofolate cyclohydrolase [Parcubacteria group bacterium Gr01-1014_107]
MIIDGKAIVEDMYQALAKRRALFEGVIKLGIVVVGENPVIESFVRTKERNAGRLNVEMVRVNLPETATQEEIIAALKNVAEQSDAVIPQLPLPVGIDIDAILSAVPNDKDVDALNPTIPEENRLVHAPVALAAVEILERGGVTIKGGVTFKFFLPIIDTILSSFNFSLILPLRQIRR